jgi:hypothetical protein
MKKMGAEPQDSRVVEDHGTDAGADPDEGAWRMVGKDGGGFSYGLATSFGPHARPLLVELSVYATSLALDTRVSIM